MLSGTAPVAELIGHAANMAAFDTAPETFADTIVFQAMYEILAIGRQTSLPAGLHPTNPPSMVVQAWHCPQSVWGAFSMLQLRVGCRSGLRPRGMVQGCVIDNALAAEALRARWGLPAQVGEVHLDVDYHRVSLIASLDDHTVCEVNAFDPVPLGSDDVSFATTVALAHTPRGDRLVQIDTALAVTRAERLRLLPYSGDTCPTGLHRAVVPQTPVAASVSRGALTLQALRFVNKPEDMAFTGTESVG